MRALVVLVALSLAAVLIVRHLERTRPQDLPWTPLDLTAPVGWATKTKLARLEADPAQCFALLDAAGVRYSRIADTRGPGEPCGFRDALVLDRSGLAYSPTPVRVSCPLAAAMVVWEREAVQPAARGHLGGEVRTALNFGTYSCRRLYGQATGNYSRHATADAIDISGFRTASGRTISVLYDWPQPGAKSAFLREVRDRGCRIFGTSLSPDYNAAHRDHLHLDVGGWSTCR